MKLLLALLLAVPALALADPLPEGATVIDRINARNEGVRVTRKLTMKLIERSGKTRVRETLGYRQYLNDQKRTAIYFLAPGNVKGTAFLTYDYNAAAREDDNWLYLPAMRKVRRISAADRGDYFLGTDMTYEDMKLETRAAPHDYRYTTLREDNSDGHRCLWVQAVPTDAATEHELGYQRVESCIDAEIWIARETRFWDIAGNPLKTVHILDIRQIQGIWTPHQINVENHKTGHRTEFTFADVDYETPIKPEAFNQNTLQRGP